MKDCGKQVVERVMYNGVKAYRVTETIGSYNGNTITIISYYSRKNSVFDYTLEDVL